MDYLLSLAKKPLYLSGLLGGATRELIRAIRRQPFNEAIFSTKDSVRQAFAKASPTPDDPDAHVVREAISAHFHSHLTMDKLSKINRLTSADNKIHCDATNLDRALALLLRGLGQLQPATTK